MSGVQVVCFSTGRNTLIISHPRIFLDHLVASPLPFSLRRVDHLISGVLMAVVVVRLYGWEIEPHYLRNLSNVCHWPLWWWCCRLIHPLMPLLLWCPLIRGMPLQDWLLTDVPPPLGVSIGVAILGHLCPKIHPILYRCLVIFPLHSQSYIVLVQVWCQSVTSITERLACLLLQCIYKRLSCLHVSGGRLSPGLSFQ